MREHYQALETAWDKRRKREFFNGVLLQSIYAIGQEKLQDLEVLEDSARQFHVEVFETVEARVCAAIQRAKDEEKKFDPVKIKKAVLEAAIRLSATPEAKTLLKDWLSRLSAAERWEKAFQRVHNCQSEWIGFEATCCKTALAVPIGCNHRLCFYCNGHRAEKYRERVRVMFDRLNHPIFLTLTVPNVRKLSKRTYTSIRFRVRKLLAQHKGWVKGGLYSLETTYNSNPHSPSYGTWHVHVHVLIDSGISLPRSRPNFIRFKRRIEFDWLLLTGGRRDGWCDSDFDYWFRGTERRAQAPTGHIGSAVPRRVIDVRPVRDREKACYEVLKYITKASDFAGIPQAVEQFMTAVRGARMLQTFGSWYGFSFPDDVNDWSHLKCNCGSNLFERRGRLFREAVYMDPVTGRWLVHQQVFCRGPANDG